MRDFVFLTRGAKRPPRVTVPDRHIVHLNDGRRLRQTETFDSGGGLGYVYKGPQGLRVIATLDMMPPEKGWGQLLHVSLSYADRDPDWTTIVMVKEAFYGDGVDAMMVLPRREDWVNLHDHCFHLWETPERWGIR